MFCRSVSVLNKKDYRWLDMFVFLSLSQFLITNRLSIFCYFKWETICCGKIASKIGFAVWQKKWFNSTINHDNQKTWVTEGLGVPIQITNCDKMAKGIVHCLSTFLRLEITQIMCRCFLLNHHRFLLKQHNFFIKKGPLKDKIVRFQCCWAFNSFLQFKYML